MRFYNHETIYEYARKEQGRRFPFKDWRQFYASMIRKSQSNRPRVIGHLGEITFREQTNICFGTEGQWYRESRPYYKVWPSIINALTSFKLTCKHGDLNLTPRTFGVRFAEGFELRSGKCSCRSFLSAILRLGTVDGPNAEMLFVFPIVFREGMRIWDGMHFWGTLVNSSPDGKNSQMTIEDGINGFNETIDDEFKDEAPLRLLITKVALMIYLMADDPSVIKPDVLADDRSRFDRSSDEGVRQRLIKRARKQGIVGWRIGEEYEAIPHFRRPHPALFHTGKGRKVPRIVFRKGCIVHREKLTQVPTGYMTPEGDEVEP